MLDTAPGKLAQVDQAVGAADIHERAEVGDRRDRARANIAFLEVLDDLVLARLTDFLRGLALAQDQAVPVAVDLDDLQRQRAADQPCHVGLLLRVRTPADARNLRGRHEPAHAVQIHQQATLVVVDHLRLQHLAVFELLLQPPPALLLACLIQ